MVSPGSVVVNDSGQIRDPNDSLTWKFKGRVAGTKCLKNQLCEFIKMREMREVLKKTPKKEMDFPSFNDVTWLIFETLCPATK